MESLIRTSEAAELLGVSRGQLWSWVASGVLSRPEYRTARDRRWPLAELLELKRLRDRQAELHRLEEAS